MVHFLRYFRVQVLNYLRLIAITLLACIISTSPAFCLAASKAEPRASLYQREQVQRFGNFPDYQVGPFSTKVDWSGLDFNSLVVSDVCVEGNRLIPSSEILRVVKSKRGDKYIRDNVSQDLKAIDALGFFDRQYLQCVPELDSHGVILKIRVRENLPVSDFVIEGNKVFSKLHIVLAQSFVDQFNKPANEALLARSLNELERMYRIAGYPQARVTKVAQLADGTVKLAVAEGQMSGTWTLRITNELPKILLASDGELAPLSNLYVGKTQYLPPTLSNAFRPSGYRVFNTRSWDQSVRNSIEPKFFQNYKFGQWDPITVLKSRSATRSAYGFKSPPKDLLPALLFRSEHKSLPYEDAPKFF